ncbi:MAG: hypothetical protein N2508_05965, partial [Anaerolineae bacterium]|nr:hypothetical protein [Anaerolineae bacterium]
MTFEPWIPWGGLSFLPSGIWEHILLVVYILAALMLLWQRRGDFARLAWRRFLLFVALLFSPLLFNHLLVLSFPDLDLPPFPGVPLLPPVPQAALIGSLPLLIGGAWLGGGPALLIGAASGLLRAGMTGGGILDPFYFAFYGGMLGSFLRQDYRGRLPSMVRQPLVAGPVATLLASLLRLLSIFAQTFSAGVAALDYAVTLTRAYLGPALLESLIASCITQVIYLAAPHLRPVRAAYRYPPYARTLNRRLLFLFVPLILLMTLVLIYAMTKTTLDMAVADAVDEMSRDAHSAADNIPYFIHTGQGLLEEFASNRALLESDPARLTDCLL